MAHDSQTLRRPVWQAPAEPADVLLRAIRARLADGSLVGLVHATAYNDDRQVMQYVADGLAAEGLRGTLISPEHVTWEGGYASVQTATHREPLALIIRFFPAEWLPNLPPSSGWKTWFSSTATPLCNPASALLTQSKRMPLVWDRLELDLSGWKALLPETRDPRDVPWHRDPQWILKPAFGRVGDGIGLQGVVEKQRMNRIRRAARWHPGHWIAQRRFEAVPWRLHDGSEAFPCLGVYVIDGRVAGIYGRAAQRPLIDDQARELAVLIEDAHSAEKEQALDACA